MQDALAYAVKSHTEAGYWIENRRIIVIADFLEEYRKSGNPNDIPGGMEPLTVIPETEYFNETQKTTAMIQAQTHDI